MDAERTTYTATYTNIHGEPLVFTYNARTGDGYVEVDGIRAPVVNGHVQAIVLSALERAWLGLVSYTAEEFKFTRDTYVSTRS